jgi:hypothetical protein
LSTRRDKLPPTLHPRKARNQHQTHNHHVCRYVRLRNLWPGRGAAGPCRRGRRWRPTCLPYMLSRKDHSNVRERPKDRKRTPPNILHRRFCGPLHKRIPQCLSPKGPGVPDANPEAGILPSPSSHRWSVTTRHLRHLLGIVGQWRHQTVPWLLAHSLLHLQRSALSVTQRSHLRKRPTRQHPRPSHKRQRMATMS